MKRTLKIVLLAVIIAVFCLSNYSFAEGEEKTLTSILLTKEPTKTEYIEGEQFDPTGMEVTALYSDETTAVIDNYTVYPDRALSISDDTVEISYTEGDITERTSIAITVGTALEQLVLNYTDITLGLQSNATWGLVVSANPNGASLPEIVWSSSNSDIVAVTPGAVDTTATLEAVSVGEAIITAQTAEGNYSVSCKVKVVDGTEEIIDTNKIDVNKITITNNDNTIKVAPKLPDTGLKIGYLLVIAVVVIIAFVSYIKNEKYKGI